MSLPFSSRSIAAATIALGGLVAAPAQAAYTGLYAFGDSLSDNGNAYAITQGQLPPLPYIDGRFSNGPVAVEYIASHLGLPLIDFAVGGATTGMGNVFAQIDAIRPTGLGAQVQDFALGHPGGADAGGLYFLYAGANDFLSGDLSQPDLVIGTAVSNIAQAVGTLYALGARSFVLPTLPDLGLTPRALGLGAPSAAGLTLLSLAFNQALVSTYATMAAQMPDERFFVIDTVLAQTSSMADMAARGGNVDTPCIITAAYPACAGYYFFDDVHPTTDAHQAFAAAVLNQVPEPAGWTISAALLLAGGVATRRRRAAATAAR